MLVRPMAINHSLWPRHHIHAVPPEYCNEINTFLKLALVPEGLF